MIKCITVKLTGAYDISNAKALVQLFSGTAGARYVIVDLSECNYVDSVAMTEMQRFHIRMRDSGSKAIFASPSARFRDLLRISNLDRVFTVTQSIEEAMKMVDEATNDSTQTAPSV